MKKIVLFSMVILVAGNTVLSAKTNKLADKTDQEKIVCIEGKQFLNGDTGDGWGLIPLDKKCKESKTERKTNGKK